MQLRPADRWDRYWGSIGDDLSVWDHDPQEGTAPYFDALVRHMDPRLPVVDVGCGNGKQTRWLAQRHHTVIGVDHSAAAVEVATTRHGEHAQFRQLDILDAEQAGAFTAEVGAANCLIRYVLHQLDADGDRAEAARVAGLLCGADGIILDMEMLAVEPADLRQIVGQSPPLHDLIMGMDHRPGQLQPGDLVGIYRDIGFEVLESGAGKAASAANGQDDALGWPMEWVLARPNA